MFRIALPPTPSAARISDAGSAESTAVAIGIVALEKDGINDCVCPLGRLNRGVESFFAPSVDSIGKKHKSFATLLFLHEFIRGEIDRVIEGGSPAVVTTMMAAAMSTARPISASASAITSSVVFWWSVFPGSKRVQRFLQLLMGRGQVLQQFHLSVEVNDEGFVLILAGHLVKKTMAGAALLIEHTALTEASVDQQAKS